MLITASRLLAPWQDPLGVLLDDRPCAATEVHPARPAAVTAGAWRRMSRLTRMVLSVCAPLLEGRPDRARIPVVWGNAMGELVPVDRFLRRLYAEGPAHLSPLNFQNSVANAPAGHLSLALGLQGLSETVAAGGASGLAALMRGADLLSLGRAQAVLVVAGDDLNPVVERAWGASGVLLGEAVAAVLLERDGAGSPVRITPGVRPPASGPVFARQTPLPTEGPLPGVPGAIAPEHRLGLVPAGGLALVAALAAAGRPGAVVDLDGDQAITAILGAP